MSKPDDDYMDPILERKLEAEHQNRSQRRASEHSGAKEERIEQEEKATLYGPFKAQYVLWFVIIVVVAFAAFIIGYYFVR